MPETLRAQYGIARLGPVAIRCYNRLRHIAQEIVERQIHSIPLQSLETANPKQCSAKAVHRRQQ